MKWTTKWLSFICSQSCVYVINATVTVAGSHGVAPSRPKRRKPTNDKLMTQQTTLQKIRFENGLAVAKSKIEYVMCRIEEIRLQLQGSWRSASQRRLDSVGMVREWLNGIPWWLNASRSFLEMELYLKEGGINVRKAFRLARVIWGVGERAWVW